MVVVLVLVVLVDDCGGAAGEQPPEATNAPDLGAFRFNTDSVKMEYYDGNQWVNIISYNDISNSTDWWNSWYCYINGYNGNNHQCK